MIERGKEGEQDSWWVVVNTHLCIVNDIKLGQSNVTIGICSSCDS